MLHLLFLLKMTNMKLVDRKINCIVLLLMIASLFVFVCSCKNEIEVAETTETKIMTLAETLGIDINDYMFILANIDNPIGEYEPMLVEVQSNRLFDERAADYLKQFIADGRSAGIPIYLSSTYRSYETQKMLYDKKVEQYGEEEAKTIVLPPGTSEHQTGLCADITDVYREFKTKKLEDTETFKWLYDNCDKYGFILRYPKDKEDITKVIYEPWHFRYVGGVAAKYMKEHNLCLEEFLILADEVIADKDINYNE